jgi:hypothetical protein
MKTNLDYALCGVSQQKNYKYIERIRTYCATKKIQYRKVCAIPLC